MSTKRMPSPSEFLAQFKGQEVPTDHLTADDAQSLDELDLDFSDLEGPRGPDESNSADAANADSTADDLQATVEAAELPDESESTPDAVQGHAQLNELFDRVHSLLGSDPGEPEDAFHPREPETLEETQLTSEEVERLILKLLFAKGSATGRSIAAQIRLPFQIMDPILKKMKQEQLLTFKGAAEMGDYEFASTDYGRERAHRYNQECTYFGSAPVSLSDYLEAMAAQSIAGQEVTQEDLQRAFSDLILSETMFERLGPAINSGRGMFLFGEPGNGKTSIAERITQAFGSTIWIPRALGVGGDIIRLFDPWIHEAVEEQTTEGLFNFAGIDQRWVQIVRPTVVAGGELTMRELEIVQNPTTKICEAPLQLKSNCGTLVIDDFGRQTMPVDVLLNRWIVPLEKRYDFLNLPCGKKVQVPFDQLIIFSTNLEPNDLVDGAFLRRIPYKIEVGDPTEEEFRKLCKLMAPITGFEYDSEAIDYLIQTHYRSAGRPFRACQPRDLLLQVRNYCVYKCIPKKMSPEAFDFAVETYFSVM